MGNQIIEPQIKIAILVATGTSRDNVVSKKSVSDKKRKVKCHLSGALGLSRTSKGNKEIK